MQQDELKKFLTDFAGERLALVQRHEAAARVVSHYDFNNTYQYVIAREETHPGWKVRSSSSAPRFRSRHFRCRQRRLPPGRRARSRSIGIF